MRYINTLAVQIRETGRASGWDLVELSDWSESAHKIPCSLALIHSEIVEAHAEFILDRMTDYDALAAEFADIVIRILDLAGGLTGDFDYCVKRIMRIRLCSNGARVFNDFHAITTAALEAFRSSDYPRLLMHLAILLVSVESYAAEYHSIDLNIAVPAKMDVNRHRSHRHGGKRV